jgi:hypothetical protein
MTMIQEREAGTPDVGQAYAVPSDHRWSRELSRISRYAAIIPYEGLVVNENGRRLTAQAWGGAVIVGAAVEVNGRQIDEGMLVFKDTSGGGWTMEAAGDGTRFADMMKAADYGHPAGDIATIQTRDQLEAYASHFLGALAGRLEMEATLETVAA